jgi:hypothetical protein
MYQTCIMLTKPTPNPLTWTQLHWSESATPPCITHHPPFRKPHNSEQFMDRLHPPSPEQNWMPSMDNIIHLCLVRTGLNTELISESKGGVRSQSARVGPGQTSGLILWVCGQSTMLSCSALLEEGSTCQRQSSCGVTQLPDDENRNISDHLRESGSKRSYSSIATCPVGRKDGSWVCPLQRSHLLQVVHTKETLVSKTLSWLPPKIFDKEGQHPSPHSPTYLPWEGIGTLRKT